jgi:membrane protein required for colicin V production
MNINYVDIIIIVVLGFNIYKGYKKGLVKLLFDLLSLFLSVYFSVIYFKEGAKLLEDYLKIHGQASYLIGFGCVWITTFIAFTYIGKFLNKFVNLSLLGPLNMIGGILVCVIKGVIFLLVFIVPLYSFGNKAVKSSFIIKQSAPYIKPIIQSIIPDEIQHFQFPFIKKDFNNKIIHKQKKLKNAPVKKLNKTKPSSK